MGATFKPILGELKEDKTGQIYIRITVNRLGRKAGTGIFIRKADFNPKGSYHLKNWVRSSLDLHDTFNNQIKGYIDKGLKGIQKALEKDTPVTPETVRAMVLGIALQEGQTFSHYYKQILERYHTPQQNRTYEKYNFALDKLHKYNKGNEVKFSQLTVEYFENFHKWLMTAYQIPHLKKAQANKLNTASKTLSFIRTIIKQAVKDKKMRYEDNPFLHISLKTEKSNKTKLSTSEIQAFIDLPIPATIKAWHARNIFLMQFYIAGSRIGDMLQLEFAHVQQGRILFQMEKTGTMQSIRVHSKALEILNLYAHRQSTCKYVFPFLQQEADYTNIKLLEDTLESQTAHINKLLKQWFLKAGVTKNVSTHVARHSFTNIARKAGVSLYDISKSLRHTTLKTTEVYLEDFDEQAVDNAIDGAFGKDVK